MSFRTHLKLSVVLTDLTLSGSLFHKSAAAGKKKSSKLYMPLPLLNYPLERK